MSSGRPSSRSNTPGMRVARVRLMKTGRKKAQKAQKWLTQIWFLRAFRAFWRSLFFDPRQHQLSVERADRCPFDAQRHELADQTRIGVEDTDAVAAGPSGETRAAFVATVNQHFFHRAHHRRRPAQR